MHQIRQFSYYGCCKIDGGWLWVCASIKMSAFYYPVICLHQEWRYHVPDMTVFIFWLLHNRQWLIVRCASFEVSVFLSSPDRQTNWQHWSFDASLRWEGISTSSAWCYKQNWQSVPNNLPDVAEMQKISPYHNDSSSHLFTSRESEVHVNEIQCNMTFIDALKIWCIFMNLKCIVGIIVFSTF